MLDSHELSLLQRSTSDINIRARIGIVAYLIIWIMMALWADIPNQEPEFFYLNLIILFVLAICRLTHYITFFKNPDKNIEMMAKLLIILVFLSALQWGLSMTWIILSGKFNDFYFPLTLATAAISFGGTFTFSISKTIRTFYPFLIIFPPSITLIVVGNDMDQSIGILSLFSMIYLFLSSKVAYNDYWQSIKNHELAEERAILMEELSNKDALTTLYNRQYFNKKMDDEWSRCLRQEISLSVLMIDLDFFKNINDTYGHVFGDECLKQVSATLKQELPRETDTVARYGGEEFIVLLPNTNQASAEIIAYKLVLAISKIVLIHEEKTVSISCSIGLACLIPSQSSSKQAIIVEADSALYKAKESGRNQYQVASDI